MLQFFWPVHNSQMFGPACIRMFNRIRVKSSSIDSVQNVLRNIVENISGSVCKCDSAFANILRLICGKLFCQGCCTLHTGQWTSAQFRECIVATFVQCWQILSTVLANTVHVDPPALSNFTGKYNPTSLKNTVYPGILRSLGNTVQHNPQIL